MQVFLLLLLLATAAQVGAAVNCIYIKPTHPTSNITCPDKDNVCVTLDQVKTNLTTLIPNRGNVTLLFLEGLHTLNSTFFGMQYLNSLTLESIPDHRVIIQLSGNSFLQFRSISTIIIKQISFSGDITSKIIMSTINFVLLQDIQAFDVSTQVEPVALSQLHPGDVTVSMVNCSFIKSSFEVGKAFSVRFIHLMIANCLFKHSTSSPVRVYSKKKSENYFKTLSIHLTNLKFINTSKDNAIELMLHFTILTGNVFINISDCVIERGVSSGILVKAYEGIQKFKIIIVNNTISFHLSAIYIVHRGRAITTIVEKCTLDSNNLGIRFISLFFGNASESNIAKINVYDTIIRGSRDVGMLLQSIAKYKMKITISDSLITGSANAGTITRTRETAKQYIHFHNTTVSYNQNGGVIVLSEADCKCSEVSIYNCTISNNHLTMVVNRAIGPQQISAGLTLWFVQEKTHVTIDRVIFLQNHDRSTHPVIFQVVNSKQISVKDCKFIGNYGSSIQLYFSQVKFIGYNVFKQNRAFDGGALSLLHSRIIIPSNSQIDFTGNHAERVGGAIFVRGLQKSLTIEATERCFYELPSVQNVEDLAALNSTLNFYNNTADIGGEDIYGAPLKHPCYVSEKRNVHSHKVAKANVFRFHSLSEKYFSSISSDPERVCLCDEQGTPRCANMSYIIQQQTRFPGEKFNVSAVLVGDEFGTVSGTYIAAEKSVTAYRDPPSTLT